MPVRNWKEIIGLNVLRLRIRAKITQVELGRRLKISQAHLSNIERGMASVDADEIPRFARELGASVGEFYMDPLTGTSFT